MRIIALMVFQMILFKSCIGSDAFNDNDDADDDEVVCGIRPGYRPGLRVFNGRNAALGAWPWTGILNGEFAVNRTFTCSMSLIDRDWAVTAAHCVYDVSASQLFGRFGDIDREDVSPYEQRVEFEKAIPHPEHGDHPYVGNVDMNDIALLKLKTPVELTNYVHPLCLNEDTNEWETYDSCWSVGWGVGALDEFPRYMQEVPYTIGTPLQCYNASSWNILDTELCGRGKAPYETGQQCGGDSGGTVNCLGADNRWYLVGVVSWGRSVCGVPSVGVQTRVSKFTEFIETYRARVENCSLPDTYCSDGSTCLLVEEICDDRLDCADGADEMNCTMNMMNGTIPETRCTNLTCLNGGVCRNETEGIECECPSGWTGDYCEAVDCGTTNFQIPVGGAVNVTSPGYPNNHTNNIYCVYYLDVPEGYKVLIEFLDFHLEAGWDFLTGLESEDRPDPSARIRWTGANVSNNFTSRTQSFILAFSADGAVTRRGFQLLISPINVTGVNECEWIPCDNNGTCTDEDDGFRCECDELYLGRTCYQENVCGEENIVIPPDSTVALSSYQYPNINTSTMRASFECTWTVTAQSGRPVQVTAVDIELGIYNTLIFLNGGDRIWDYKSRSGEVYISEGSVLKIQSSTQYGTGERYLLELSEKPDGDECASDPCQNGGRCYDKENDFICKCRRGYTGKLCHIGVSACRGNRFTCANQRCITPYFVCDGKNHCGDGSDEKNCDCEFRCHNGRCIPKRYVCDSRNNCQDWSDELASECGSD